MAYIEIKFYFLIQQKVYFLTFLSIYVYSQNQSRSNVFINKELQKKKKQHRTWLPLQTREI